MTFGCGPDPATEKLHDGSIRGHAPQGDRLARLAPDGHLLHLGRADQMMIMNGINIYPGEIEQVLCAHPGVRDAVALPFRHPVQTWTPVMT